MIKGSAERALSLEPGFDTYVLIEKDEEAVERLHELKTIYSEKKVQIVPGDANDILQDICSKDWSKHRAVVFLDPTGMHVQWSTMEALARTKAVDVWVWFPIGVAVNRLLTRNGRKIMPGWERTLDQIFGTSAWREAFYDEFEQYNLITQKSEKQLVKTASFKSIAEFYNDRLSNIFDTVAPNPRMMTNSRNNPIYLPCFASANEKGGPIALRAAEYLLGKV